MMTPAELIRSTRERKGLSQRRLAFRAGTSQSAIARIERGDEEVTWSRMRSILLSMGEEAVLTTRPVPSRYDAWDLLEQRRMSPTSRLESGLAWDNLGSELAVGVASKKVGAPPEPVFDPRRMLLALTEHGVDFVVVGGVAVQTHGHGRYTRDLDVVPRPDLLNLSRLGEALASLGARLRRAAGPVDVTDPQLLKRAPLVPLMTVYGRLDLINAALIKGGPRSYEELRGRAVEAPIDGRTVAVAGLDDLIRMKRAAGRDQDVQDIGALTRSDEDVEREAPEST
jgi:transcriptional regulator with XRE-family HTH domain